MPAPTEAEIDRVLHGAAQASDAADYADRVVFEPEQVQGTRYKYVLTEAHTT